MQCPVANWRAVRRALCIEVFMLSYLHKWLKVKGWRDEDQGLYYKLHRNQRTGGAAPLGIKK